MRLWSAGLWLSFAVLGALLTPMPPPASPAVQPVAFQGVYQLDPAASCPVQGDFEGRFTHSSQMPVFLECVLGGIESWIDETYERMPHPQAYYFISSGARGVDEGCPFTSNSMHYCRTTQAVYLGQDAIWRQYRGYGDAAPVVVLAHEVTHHFQRRRQMPAPQVPNDQIRYENQADCGAGAFMSWAESKGMLDRRDDIRDLAGSLADAAEAEGDQQTHGTIQERLSSFDEGFLPKQQPALHACNGFVPERKIITSS